MRTLMATALAAILPLAGCFGGEASPAASPSPAQPLAADVGAIEGLVVDAEQRPVAEATVRAENTDLRVNRSATTGEDGRFRFADLPVGKYWVAVDALFFERSLQHVEVLPAEVASVTIALVDVADAPSLYVEVFTKKGFINCSIHSLGGYGPINFCEQVAADEAKFELPLRADLANRGAVVEVVWSPATPATGTDLELAMCDEKDEVQDPLNCRSSVGTGFRRDTRGKSPLVLRVAELPLAEYPSFQVSVGDGGQTAARVPLTFQQSFDLWMSLCYGEPCPLTYQARPPS